MEDPQAKAVMEQVARVAADEAVRKTFVMLGIDHSRPFDVQKDMASLRELREMIESEEFRKDMVHLRRWRKTVDSIENKGILAIVSLLIAGGVAALAFAFRGKFFGA